MRWGLPVLVLLALAAPSASARGPYGLAGRAMVGWGRWALPEAPRDPVEPPPPPPPSVLVQAGDSLWKLAARHCGDGHAWREIYRANQDRIANPNLVYPGQELVLPCAFADEEEASVPAAAVPPEEGEAPAPAGPPSGVLTHHPLGEAEYRVSSRFGPRHAVEVDSGGLSSREHRGVDLAAPRGTPVLAAGGGRVLRAGWVRGYGWVVYLLHADGTQTRYAHLRRRPRVRAGERVEAGSLLGEVGATGDATGPHLHFEVRDATGEALDPAHRCAFL